VGRLVVIVGMSGAGRSTAADVLEDLGFFVIDNLPPELIPKVVDLAGPGKTEGRSKGVVLVLGRSGKEGLQEAERALAEIKERQRVETVFLDAPDDVLVKRFEGTRRRHPFGSDNLLEAIAQEREAMASLRAMADVVIDTGETNVHQLRDRLVELFATDAEKRLAVTVISFGFAYGIPLDADMLFDVRFLPNPHWVPELRERSGLEDPVRSFVLASDQTRLFMDRTFALIDLVLPGFIKEGKSYLTIGVGCTGGHHRSVVVAEEMARHIHSTQGLPVKVIHRDLDR
jgi:UPF0042 nucleotide-binding protein